MSVEGVKGTHLYCSDATNKQMVKKVIDYKLLNGKKYYKVKWECTWELEDNLLSCKGLVDQFWDFVNRVKSEDDIDSRSNTNEIVHRNNLSTKNSSKITEEIPCVQIIPDDKSNDDSSQHSENDQFKSYQMSDDLIRKPLVNIKPGCKGENILDENNIPNLPSMVTINPPRQELQISSFKNGFGSAGHSQHQSPMFKRIYGVMDQSEDNNKSSQDIIDLKLQRQTLSVNCDERRFQCHVCGMAFKRKDMCKRHLRTHTNDCCYFCAICKKGFIRRYVLVKHLNKDHQTNDQTQILSTKRRRRDDVKHDPLIRHQFLSKSDDSSMNTAEQSEFVLDSSETIDDEHDYDRKTDNVVVVLKVESDDNKIDSTIDSSIDNYPDNKVTMDDNIDFPIKSSSHNEEKLTFIKSAVVPSSSEHNVDVNISVTQSEKTVDNSFIIYNRNNSPISNDFESTGVSYNQQFSFPSKNPNINHQLSQHE